MKPASKDIGFDRKVFVLLVTIALSGIFFTLIRHYLLAVFVAAIFGVLLHPSYLYVQRLLRTGPSTTSLLIILVFFVAVGIPLFALAGLAASEALAISRSVTPWISEHVYNEGALAFDWPAWLPFRAELETYQTVIFEKLGEIAGGVAQFLFNAMEDATRGTIGALLSLFIFTYALFFFLRRGPETVNTALGYLPLSDGERQLLIGRGLIITKAVLKSVLIIGVLQGALMGLAFWVLGIGAAVFWAMVVVVLSAIPVLGSGIVWVPAAIYLLANGQQWEALGLAIWGIFIVGFVDNILRPRIVGEEAKVPDLLILLAILGGIGGFGPVGLLVGPILAVILLTVLEMYRTEVLEQIPTES